MEVEFLRAGHGARTHSGVELDQTVVIPDVTKIAPRKPSGIANIRYNEVRYSEGRLSGGGKIGAGPREIGEEDIRERLSWEDE